MTLQGSVHRERIFWLLCLPALIAGLIARVALELHFPYAYLQADSADFLITAERLMIHHELVLHGKKVFLTPVLFTLPFLVRLPALLVIPAMQHLLGLLLTVMTGALVRLWFAHWRWFIVPVTLLAALNPASLWYEHALLAEFHFLFCITGLALVGSVFAREPTRRHFIWLLVALFLTAGSRPEGKLFLPFALLLVILTYFGQGRIFWQRVAVTLAASAVIWLSGRSTQAGLLLYATVLPLAPDVPKSAPDFAPFINPLRDQYRAEGETVRLKMTTAEKAVNEIVQRYFSTQKNRGELRGSERDVSGFCQRLAVEAMLHKPWLLPAIAVNKLIAGCKSPSSGGYTEYWVRTKQYDSFTHKKWLTELLPGLTGEKITTDEQAIDFVARKYQPLQPDWFEVLQRGWNTMTIRYRVGNVEARAGALRALPLFFWIALVGGIVGTVRPLWRVHVAWLLGLLGVWFLVLLTGVVNPRYRFAFEPFCLIYIFLLVDSIWLFAEATFRKHLTERPTT
ncbi:MAG: hypothetical protein QOD99_279 [Chthoniobacter sp.]|nr:hypothetical protein [Chthoniobacter sp.]